MIQTVWQQLGDFSVPWCDLGSITGPSCPRLTVAAAALLKLLVPTMASKELLMRLEQKAVQAEQMIDLLTRQVNMLGVSPYPRSSRSAIRTALLFFLFRFP